MRKILLLVFLLTSLYGRSQLLQAYPDTFIVMQANIDTFYVTNADSIPTGDSVCISLVDTSVRFSVLDCKTIIYHPDSLFTGRDTCRYALCDTAGMCDTTTVVIYVDTNRALLPVAYFIDDTSYSNGYSLFICNNMGFEGACSPWTLVNQSQKFDSLIWIIQDTCQSPYCQFVVKYYDIDTLTFTPWNIGFIGGTDSANLYAIQISIVAFNKYGSTTYTDTTCALANCEGITGIPLSNIHIYPNPADKLLTIDMSLNNNQISTNYTSITLYNSLGQRVSSLPHGGKVIDVPTACLPDGIYIATITDKNEQENVLGRFVISH